MNRTLTSEAFLGSIGLPLFDPEKFIQEKSRQLELEAKNAAQEAERKFKEEYYKSDDIRYASFDRPSKSAADADQQGAIVYSSKLNDELQNLQADFAKEFSARELQAGVARESFDGALTPEDVRQATASMLLNENVLRDGALQYTKDQERDLKWIAEPDSGKAVDALQKQARLDQINRDNLIARKNDILEQRRAAHIAAEDDRINKGVLSAKSRLDDHKESSNEAIQRLQNAVDENNNIWGKLSGKHGKAQDALKDFKAESDAELKRLEEDAKPRPFDEQKANKDLDALISKHSDAANASQKALEDARQKAREEGAEKAKTLKKQAEQKQQPKHEQPKPVEAPVQAPDQKPEVPRAEPEKPVEQPTQVPEQKKPEQPSRDQVPPAQEPPVQKPEPQQVPEQPKPSPEKPTQKPDAPIRQGDQLLPPREPAQNKPPEQPSSRPDNKAIPEQKGNPVNPSKPGQTNADGKQGELPKLKDGPPKIDSYVRDDNGRYKKPSEGKTAFIDKGDAGVSVRRPPSNADLGAAMKLLQQKGANNIQLNGSDEFKKRAWIEANARGMKTKGYEPTQEDKRAMQNRAEQLRKVSEMNGVNRGASQTLGARQNQGGRKPREEDQPPPPPPKPIQQTQGAIR